MNDKSREKAIEGALAAEEDKAQPERREIPWQDSAELLLVVNIPLTAVALNARSHRIRAQLEGHDKQHLVEQDPFSDDAQDVIADLLRETKRFEELKRDLEFKGQQEPGVVTRQGVLVNANRRAVALRDLGKTHIRATVLPKHATTDQIHELELRLQMRRELREDYSFTNELLFIHDCIEGGWTDRRIAQELGYVAQSSEKEGIKRVKQAERILNLIEEIRRRSSKRYRYQDFDEAQQALEELDRDYEALKKNDPDAALRLRHARMTGILTGVGYRELRSIDSDFVSEHLEEDIREDPDLSALADDLLGGEDNGEGPAGVDELFGSSDGQRDPGKSLLSWMESTANNKTVQIEKSGVVVERSEIISALRGAIETAARDAADEAKREDLVESPLNRVKEAKRKVDKAREQLKKALLDKRFDEDRLKTLEADLNILNRKVGSLLKEVGDSLSKRKDGKQGKGSG